jgi:branched-subunit amino acid transport protein
MATSYADPVVWAVFLTIGVATYCIRFSFVGLFGYVEEIPPALERPLRFVPAAVLAALVAPAFVTVGPAAGGLAVEKLAGGALAAAVAWRTGSVIATMAVGMGTLWVVRFLVLPAM